MPILSSSFPANKDSFFSWNNIRSLGGLVLIVVAVRWSVAAPYHVPTPSMEPSIKVGDRLLANHLAYQFRVPFTNVVLFRWDKPKRGDVIVFDSVDDPGTTLVKRVVGQPGDTVEVRDGLLLVNGEIQGIKPVEDQESVLHDATDSLNRQLYTEDLSGYQHYVMHFRAVLNTSGGECPHADGTPLKVPEDSVFMMGDNRDNSRDSRCFGLVKIDNVFGKTSRILWSMYFKREDGFAGWIPQFRFYRFGSHLN
jgi:signal peptidase I